MGGFKFSSRTDPHAYLSSWRRSDEADYVGALVRMGQNAEAVAESVDLFRKWARNISRVK